MMNRHMILQSYSIYFVNPYGPIWSVSESKADVNSTKNIIQHEVISGLNTSSSASALLGPMMQEREARRQWWVSKKIETWMNFFRSYL